MLYKYSRITTISHYQGVLGGTVNFPENTPYGKVSQNIVEDVIENSFQPNDIVDVSYIDPSNPNIPATISITYSEYVEKTPVVKQPFKKEFVFDDIPF